MPESNKEVDFLLVGQGLAGSLLAWFLDKQGKRVHLVDNNHKGSSSIVAAGIINPITGRRLVKSWRFDELLPLAKATYLEIEEALSVSLYQERKIFRALSDIQSVNQWDERSGEPGYEQYLSEIQPTEAVQRHTKKPFSWGAIHHAAQVDVPVLLQAIRRYFLEKGAITSEEFDYNKLIISKDDGIYYNNIHAKQLVCCEGQQARFNPWFGQLPFVVSKGEMLEIEIAEATDFPILKHHAYIAPLGKNRFWVGATYEWNELNEEPSEKGKKQLITNLNKSIVTPYTIIQQYAAIRPTVKDRRPFLGTHPDYPCLHIFNGLGTKGTSLGPFWGLHFVDYLLGKAPLNAEVNIQRFNS
jgi:glycine oxidase